MGVAKCRTPSQRMFHVKITDPPAPKSERSEWVRRCFIDAAMEHLSGCLVEEQQIKNKVIGLRAVAVQRKLCFTWSASVARAKRASTGLSAPLPSDQPQGLVQCKRSSEQHTRSRRFARTWKKQAVVAGSPRRETIPATSCHSIHPTAQISTFFAFCIDAGRVSATPHLRIAYFRNAWCPGVQRGSAWVL